MVKTRQHRRGRRLTKRQQKTGGDNTPLGLVQKDDNYVLLGTNSKSNSGSQTKKTVFVKPQTPLKPKTVLEKPQTGVQWDGRLDYKEIMTLLLESKEDLFRSMSAQVKTYSKEWKTEEERKIYQDEIMPDFGTLFAKLYGQIDKKEKKNVELKSEESSFAQKLERKKGYVDLIKNPPSREKDARSNIDFMLRDNKNITYLVMRMEKNFDLLKEKIKERRALERKKGTSKKGTSKVRSVKAIKDIQAKSLKRNKTLTFEEAENIFNKENGIAGQQYRVNLAKSVII